MLFVKVLGAFSLTLKTSFFTSLSPLQKKRRRKSLDYEHTIRVRLKKSKTWLQSIWSTKAVNILGSHSIEGIFSLFCSSKRFISCRCCNFSRTCWRCESFNEANVGGLLSEMSFGDIFINVSIRWLARNSNWWSGRPGLVHSRSL